MTQSLIECIPNFSEAQDQKVIKQICNAINSVAGVMIIDQHSDIDHNRTVITMLGTPQAIEEAAFRCVEKAAELIDLNRHTGQHPRIGATDVLPFVPIRKSSMMECVEMARRVGKRIGSELNIPVYLYEEAATREDRRQLENIRRGQFEGLKDEIKNNPARLPDYGPAQLGPAGAIAVGARSALVAFNVYLNSADIEIAKKIASTVRHSSGGLRYVKALAMLVDGMAQVSMNLTNFEHTPIPQVVEMVRREALRYGVMIHHTELVGLIPQKALINAAQWYLQLDQFSQEQILENKINAASSDSFSSVQQDGDQAFLEKLSSASEYPGEISAIGHTALISLALITMTARRAAERSLSDETRTRMISLIERLETFQTEFAGTQPGVEAALEQYRLAGIKHTTDPEKAAANIEDKEFAFKKYAEQLVEFASRCASITSLALVIAENCEGSKNHGLLTAGNLADVCFLSACSIVQSQLVQCTDDQAKRILGQQISAASENQKQVLQQLRKTIIES